jgi:hypothetical protein
MALLIVVLLAALVRSGQLTRAERGAVRTRDAAPRRDGPEPDTTGDASGPKAPLAVRLDELEYRFAALKQAHEQLSESIGTRFATMGKRIQRATGEPVAPIAEDDPAQSDFLTALGAVPTAPRNGAPPARRLVPRLAPRR